MRIVAVREKTVSLAGAARNASIGFGAMTASVVAIHTDAVRDGKPLTGLAFDSIGRYGHGGLLRERFIPRLTAASPDSYDDGKGGLSPAKAWNVLMQDEKAGGHGERSGAVGVLDAALWDLAAKAESKPLWAVLPGARSSDGRVALYASGGHYRPQDDIPQLQAEIRKAIGEGHRRFKIKIGGVPLADDCARIEAVLALLDDGMTLAVDCNGTFDRDKALAYITAFSTYPLSWIEEPVHPLDYELHKDIAAHSPLPLAVGENIFSRDDLRNLLRYGGLRSDRDIIQCDVSLSYGIVEYQRILDELAAHGWSAQRCAPHAGHLLAAHCVAGFGLGMAEVALDGDSAFGRMTASLAIEDGMARLPDAPGTGFETLPCFTEVFGDLLH
jgi:L-alanine-DL-glutamate epimerase-like enolase superfamily enzyme